MANLNGYDLFISLSESENSILDNLIPLEAYQAANSVLEGSNRNYVKTIGDIACAVYYKCDSSPSVRHMAEQISKAINEEEIKIDELLLMDAMDIADCTISSDTMISFADFSDKKKGKVL